MDEERVVVLGAKRITELQKYLNEWLEKGYLIDSILTPTVNSVQVYNFAVVLVKQ